MALPEYCPGFGTREHGYPGSEDSSDNTLHKVFTNVAYFWKDPLANMQELRRLMKPGRRLALYVIAKDDLLNFKVTQTGVYQLYAGEDLVRLLTQAGFHQARFVTKSERHRTGICALAEK